MITKMKLPIRLSFIIYSLSFSMMLASCSDDSKEMSDEEWSEARHMGKAVGNFTAEEWYAGGELGTTMNVTQGCYEDETPDSSLSVMSRSFRHLSTDWALPMCESRVSTVILAMVMASVSRSIMLSGAMAICWLSIILLMA